MRRAATPTGPAECDSDQGECQFVSVAQMIWQLAESKPENIALVAECRQVSFGELVQAANTLATSFRLAGAEGGGVVALCTGNAFEMIVGAMAAWRIRCSYLPLDPAAPHARLLHMLTGSKAVLVAAPSHTLSTLPSGPWQKVAVTTGAHASNDASLPLADNWIVEPDEIAYVIYTSGSTGAPKGIAVTQTNLACLVNWYASAFGVTCKDRAMQMASLTFDASVLEIWTNLSQGVPLYILDRLVERSPEHLRDFFVTQQISISFVATPLAEELIAMEWPQHTKLRFLLTGADTLRSYPPAKLPFQLVNNYGPTECTVLASSGIVPSSNGQNTAPSIGKVVEGATIYILDHDLLPVRDNEVGEIFIGGAGVANGYIGNPALTAERFLPDPFHAGQRLYRTGDRGRKLSNGELEFCGRSDSQIKLRGYRIEPEEIVIVLRSHVAVRNAFVGAFECGERHSLAAFVVLDDGISDSDLRSHLTAKLPEYMIPDQFVRMANLPLTPQGKIDRAALKLPEKSVSAEDTSLPTEDNEIQSEVFEIVSRLLGIARLGPHDNFFRLGGHSLLAAQLITRVRKAFGIELPIRVVFEAPTIASLSGVIEEKLLAQLSDLNPQLLTEGLISQPEG